VLADVLSRRSPNSREPRGERAVARRRGGEGRRNFKHNMRIYSLGDDIVDGVGRCGDVEAMVSGRAGHDALYGALD